MKKDKVKKTKEDKKKNKEYAKSNPIVKKTLISAIAFVACVALAFSSLNSGVASILSVKQQLAEAAALEEMLGSEVGLDQQGSLEDVPDVVLPGTGSEGGAEGGAEGGEGAEGGQAAPVKPEDGVHTLKYYNAVIDKAVNGKVGYQKTRLTDNENMDGSAALQAMKDLVYKFMGIGAANVYTENVEKGKWGDVAFLVNSKLEASDVTEATCVEDGSNYVITINLKSGVSNATQSSNKIAPTSALDKCGICVGAEDKGYFDHKTASVIYDAIDDIYPTAEIKETYTNAKVIATVDAKTGNLIKLVVEWNESVSLSKLLGMSATASGVCHVTYTNFKY